MNAFAQAAKYGMNWMLEAKQQQQRNARWIQQMLLAQRNGHSVLPYFLGLEPLDFYCATGHQHFRLNTALLQANVETQIYQNDTRQQLLAMRRDEWQELVDLMVSHRAGLDDSEMMIAQIVAAGCLGGAHLWRGLGLDIRQELSDMLEANFPSLALTNTQNMKWKKFFYKQLCDMNGDYVCRAPSCEVCSARAECFGPEQ